jgi:hypothetical protein
MPVRSVHAATPKGRTLPPAVVAFLGFLDEAVAELQAAVTGRSG